jgi:hypothetical protein
VSVDGGEQRGAVARLPDHPNGAACLQDSAQPGPHERLVVGEHNADGRLSVCSLARHMAEGNRSTRVSPSRAQLFRDRFSRTRTEIRTGDPVNPNSSRSRRSRNRR